MASSSSNSACWYIFKKRLFPECRKDKHKNTRWTINNLILHRISTIFSGLFFRISAGPGEISIRLIKSCKFTIGEIYICLNECNKKKVFPTKMKLAYVTPIFKKGDKLDSPNYRPISLTPSFAKIFERLLLTQMMNFIGKHQKL